ncbi:MAG: response regulator transcription factor [Hyphomicrobiales bacterium]
MHCGRVVLADSHPGMLEGMRRMLETEAKSVVMVADEASLIQAVERMTPDLVVADLSFPVSGAANVVRLIKQRHPETKVIIVSVHDDPAAVSEVVDAKAEGFVLKRRAVVDLIPAIHEVCQGRRYVSLRTSSSTEP